MKAETHQKTEPKPIPLQTLLHLISDLFILKNFSEITSYPYLFISMAAKRVNHVNTIEQAKENIDRLEAKVRAQQVILSRQKDQPASCT